jgi:serine/threonine-protein kinase RsbW
MKAVFRMSIGADLDEVAKVLSAFGVFADAEGLPASARRAAFVVLDELLANTVSHGLEGRDDGEVTVEVSWSPGWLTLTVSDNGRAFDPFARAAPDTTLSVEDRPIGGLGIHLVKQLVDEVSYRRDAHHNIVVLTMRVAGKDTHVNSENGQ